MADFENKMKETAEQAKDFARLAANDVKEEADLVKADAKGYAKGALEDVKSEGKEVLQELKAAVKKEDLSGAAEGEAGYRAQDNGKPSGIAIAAVAFGALGLLLPLIIKSELLALVLGLLGLVAGAKARKESQTRIATYGFILSGLAAVLALLNIIF